MNQIAIVITAYNREKALASLLQSLSNILTDQNITLIVSIDNGGTNKVNRIAKDYYWRHGEKRVIIHKEKKGLVNHFIWTGDQTKEFEYVIFLEDDFIVSSCVIDSANQIIDFYKDDNNVAAASLYNPIICEMTGTKFFQIEDGFDFYFLQQPYWGMIWFKNKWNSFKKYLQNYIEKKELLPEAIAQWNNSFKKIYIQYLVENKKYVATPRISLVTNNGVVGLHSSVGQYHFQNVLLMNKMKYRLCKCIDSFSRYDAFMEIEPNILKFYNNNLKDYNFTVDTKGIHKSYTLPYVLTTKQVKGSLFRFSSLMKPIEASVIFNEKGDTELKLCKKEDIVETKMYYFKRRFLDIKKNYWIGINAGLNISFETITRSVSIVLNKLNSK